MEGIKTVAFINYNRQILLIDKLLVDARENESHTNIELWAAYSFDENDDFRKDNIYHGSQQERRKALLKVPDVISKLDELENDLELEMSSNYIVNNKEAFTKYADVIAHTFSEHLNINSERLFKSKYSLLVEEGLLTDKEEEKKMLLLRNLPYRLSDIDKIDSYDLAAWFYLTLQKNYEQFVSAHNFLIHSIISNDRSKSLKLESIFKEEKYYQKCLEILDHLDAENISQRQGYILFAVIDAIKQKSSPNLLNKTYSDDVLLSVFNTHLNKHFSQIKRNSKGFDEKKSEVKVMLSSL